MDDLGYENVSNRFLWKLTLAVLLLVLFFIAHDLWGITTPSFTCVSAVAPHVKCEVHGNAEYDATFNVYYWNSTEIADTETGIVVYLTLPREKWTLVEVSVQDIRMRCEARWHDGKAEFRNYLPVR